MRLGLQIPDFTWPGGPAALGPTLRRIAQDAEASGMASVWVMDHFFQISMVGPAENDMLEGWSTLAHLAAVTEKVTLGTMVTGVTYRHPGVLVKTATTLDVLSGGRAWFGIGAAWNEEEHVGLGVPYPPLAERFERLEETLQVAHRMWAGDESPYEGRHYTLARPLNVPAALSSPHPKVLVGGTGEKKTLRMVAQYADACNIFEMGPDAVSAKLDVLRGHCERLGRAYADIERTTLGRLDLVRPGAERGPGSQTVDEAVERFAGYAAVGVDHAIVSMPRVADPAAWELVPELVAALGKITPAGR